MEMLLRILGAFAIGAVGYWFFLLRRYRIAADTFKGELLPGIEQYRSDATTLSAVVLTTFPAHNAAFEQFLLAVPRRKHDALKRSWGAYSEVYEHFRGFGVFGVAMAEAPHPDFEPTPENVQAVSRKRKAQVVAVLESFINDL